MKIYLQLFEKVCLQEESCLPEHLIGLFRGGKWNAQFCSWITDWPQSSPWVHVPV